MARILLAEDNLDNLMIYTVVLKHADFDVVAARDGEEGIPLAREYLPELILMDLSAVRHYGFARDEFLDMTISLDWLRSSRTSLPRPSRVH